jgi:DNA-binding beta-propeller fold protein YncE
MKTQRSRNSFDALKRYSGVYQQMGRMFTDSDWNELSALVKHRLDDALTDVIGVGTPRERGMVEITDNGDGTNSYTLNWGYAYVDGIIAQARPAADAMLSDPAGKLFEYEHQADFPDAPALPGVDYQLYLDVWERTVLSLEDENLRDPGLHGADTCTRTQTMAQVKWCPLTLDPEDIVDNPPIGDAELTLTLREGSTEPDPCDPCSNEVALLDKVGNYLFRVEIHHVEYDNAGSPERIVIKWSGENGAEQYFIDNTPAGFESNNFAYEFYSGETENFASEKHLGRHLATGFVAKRGELQTAYPETPPAAFSLVRRWDGYCELLKSGVNWTLVDGSDRGVTLSTSVDSEAHGHVSEGLAVIINLDAITLELSLDDNDVLAGDYWAKEVRDAVDRPGDDLLTDALPNGIQHHYMTLGSVSGGVFTAFDSEQCKRFDFPPLTDIRAGDVCYDNDACDMPDVGNVQDAIDYLCQARDLRWHNKHLHGWGIVCGLIVKCGSDTFPDDSENDEAERRHVRVTSGYALTCEGDDVVLDNAREFDLMERIERLEESGATVLDDNGDGAVCLRIDLGPDGLPAISVEAYDPKLHKKSILDGTLLLDFYEHCILDLRKAVLDELDIINPDEIDEVEGGETGLVSDQRRKLTTVINLLIQLANAENGSYVFLSRKEHNILKDLYDRLRKVLQSSTFCAMFQDESFPEYPFKKSGMTTLFGKNGHTRVKVHPDGEHLYTYGGTDNTINVYDLKKEELISVLEMPSAEGAETTAITFSPDGELLYAAANVRGIDSVLGIARIADKHAWEEMAILCDLEIVEMEVSQENQGLIYAVGLGRGLFFLNPKIIMDESKPRPQPVYEFNAAGHMAIDTTKGLAYCTDQSDKDIAKPESYNQIAVCNLQVDADAADGQAPSSILLLRNTSGVPLSGTDGLAIRVLKKRDDDVDIGGRLYVVADAIAGNTGQSDNKLLLTFALPVQPNSTNAPTNVVLIEKTQVSLAYHAQSDRLLLAMEDGYRLQMFEPNGNATNFYRIPVQIQPVDVVVNKDNGQVYTLNFLSNTISVIPAKELAITDAFLDTLAIYRTDVLLAFYGLFGNVLQYIKDCFCDHLLVKCPDCDGDEILYLANVEIRDRQVYKVCNFDKRKYVKSFPAVDYWLSLVPVAPLIEKAVSKFCCWVLPNFFDRKQDDWIKRPQAGDARKADIQNRLSAKTSRESVQTYARTDVRAVVRRQATGARLVGNLAGDSLVNLAETGRRKDIGIKKQALINNSVNDATIALKRNQIEVAGIQAYDAKKANQYIADYTQTPQRLEPGSKVTLIQRDGKVVFYRVERPKSIASVEISDEVKAELAQFEKRKADLSDFSTLNAELARTETRRANVAELTAIKNELSSLQTEKLTVEEELAGLKSQVDSVKTQRLAEEQKLVEMSSLRSDLSNDLTEMNSSLLEMKEMHDEIKIGIIKDSPVTGIAGVTKEMNLKLREAGILTLEDLTKADVTKLSRETAINRNTLTKIITSAKDRLK